MRIASWFLGPMVRGAFIGLTFSDGTVVIFASLPNNGVTGLTVTLATPIVLTSVLMTATGVSATTFNLGLSEIQAFGTAA